MGISISTKKSVSKGKTQERDSPVGMERELRRTESYRYLKCCTSDSGYPTTVSSRTHFPGKLYDDCASFSDLSVDEMSLSDRKTDFSGKRSKDYKDVRDRPFGRTPYEERLNLDVSLIEPSEQDRKFLEDSESMKDLYIPGTVVNGSMAKRESYDKKNTGEIFRRNNSQRKQISKNEFGTDFYIFEDNGPYCQPSHQRKTECQENTNTSDPRNRPGAARAERRRVRSESVPPRTDIMNFYDDELFPGSKNHVGLFNTDYHDNNKSQTVDIIEYVTKLLAEKSGFSDDIGTLKSSKAKFGVNVSVDPGSDVIHITLPGKLFLEEPNTCTNISQRKRTVKRHQSLCTKSWR